MTLKKILNHVQGSILVDEIGGYYYEERGMDFQSHYYDLIYQQLCFSDTNWLDVTTFIRDKDYPDYEAYPYSVFDDVRAVFGITKNGLFLQFQNYSIGKLCSRRSTHNCPVYNL